MSAFGDDGGGPIYVGVGYGLVAPSAEPKPVKNDREYVAGNRGIIRSAAKQALSQSIDSLTRQFGWQVYDAILVDPVAGGAFDILRLGVLGNGMQFPPAVKPASPADPVTPEMEKAAEVAAFCERLTASLDRPWIKFLWEALEALGYGNKLAEKVYRIQDVGPDKGQYVFAKLKFKPRWTWLFVTDGKFNVLGIMAWTADQTGVTVLPRDKFAVFTWDDRDGDPRGNSILRRAYEAWNQKVLTWPDYEKFRNRFGNPVPIGKTAQGEMARPPVDRSGKPIPGAPPVSPQEYLVSVLVDWSNGAAIAVPFGTEVDLAEPEADGELYLKAIELFNREISHAILKNTRTTQEAEHGSKADSETGQDVTEMSIRLIRQALCDFVRREVLLPAVELRYGKEDAHAFTPMPTLGDSEKRDFAKYALAVAALKKSGFLDDSQLPGCDERLGLPIRDLSAPAADAEDEPDDADEVERDEAEDDAERREEADPDTRTTDQDVRRSPAKRGAAR